MKPFALDSSMTTMGGVFYPTGYVFLMVPTRDAAGKAAQALLDGGVEDNDISLVTPEMIQEKIARTVGNADIPLPSAGTEGDTVRRFAELASRGHHALMVHAPKAEQSDRVMDLLKGHEISYAQKYRKLVIEDLV
jgi:hypothetical protein